MTTSVTLLYNMSIEKFVNLESSRWKTRMGFTLYLCFKCACNCFLTYITHSL